MLGLEDQKLKLTTAAPLERLDLIEKGLEPTSLCLHLEFLSSRDDWANILSRSVASMVANQARRLAMGLYFFRTESSRLWYARSI
jgi:hypothetical protein